ncbi:hypothetical protein [Mesorhizobium sp. YM1C-6-2]|uniref:hypothetical protein n=1 Tax=Mesorhizobium sp. YM1C-6-2 TaxID=1827501 RepID=UPI000EF29030|nr:hypothetical protein [Mesorhizobium sp. YM1C-6-2]RLP22753.1 hypothetical protein D8676_22745 [Mesorhizobium sp. YM1C-6-2]
MMAALPAPKLLLPTQNEIDWLLSREVSTFALVRPMAIMVAVGDLGQDGHFEGADTGARWLAFEQERDLVLWQPRRRLLVSECRRAFALGEDIVDNPGTYAFDCNLNIFADPLEWLRANRDGIVIIDWRRAFDRLRDVPRVAIAEALLPTYRQAMRPGRMPELLVIPERRRAAA